MQQPKPAQQIIVGSGSLSVTKRCRILRYIVSPRGIILGILTLIIFAGASAFAILSLTKSPRHLEVQPSTQSPVGAVDGGGGSAATATTQTTDNQVGKTTPATKNNKAPVVTSDATPTQTPTPTTTVVSSGYPNASNTGSSGTLRTVSGDVLLNSDGEIFENARVQGRITVDANNVTIRNVEVINNDYWVVLNYGLNMMISDATLIGGSSTQASIGDANSGYFTGRRLNISGAGDGLKMGGGSKVYASYIHDLATFDGAHNDGIEVNGSNVTISGNTILNQNPQTSAIFNISSNVVIDGNFLAGGGYTIYGGSGDSATNISVTNNVFSTMYFPSSGYYGPSAYWPSGSVWSNNSWYDGPNKGAMVAS